jgi:hypothetical protein
MTGAAAPSAGFSLQQRNRADGLCRRADALPPMPPEQAVAQRPREEANDLPRLTLSPSPSPPPPMTVEALDSSSVVVSGSRTSRGSRPSAAPPSRDRRGSRPAPEGEPQSGQLTAGDHDDLLNPDLYADYVGKFLQHQQVDGIPFVDTRRVLTVAVQDRSGRPMPFVRVMLTCADGNSLALDTLADGTVAFFPALDRLGNEVRLSVEAPGAGAEARTIRIAGGAQRQTVTLDGAPAPVGRFDLAIVLDTTGSMGDEIEFLKSELRAIVDHLRRGHGGLDIRLALVAYRDEGDIFVTHTYRFDGSVETMQAQLSSQSGDGGGDEPEAMDQALARAMTLDWRDGAVRSMMLVADAPPHDENVAKTWQIAEAARARRIQIVPVAASGVNPLAEYMMRAMAAATQSRFLFLTDDSGIGNPHAEPAIDCYLVTRLDTLVRRVLDSQISGRRIEPREGEVIRSVGDYQDGRCVLPPDFEAQALPRR